MFASATSTGHVYLWDLEKCMSAPSKLWIAPGKIHLAQTYLTDNTAITTVTITLGFACTSKVLLPWRILRLLNAKLLSVAAKSLLFSLYRL